MFDTLILITNSMNESPDAITPLRESRLSYGRPVSGFALESPRASIYKTRHISLQSRVDSLQEFRGLDIDYRSRSYLLDSQTALPFDNEKIDRSEEDQYLPNMTADLAKSAPPPAIKMSTFREVMFIGVVIMAHFMTQGALGQALVPMDIIGESFTITNPGQTAWFIAGYSLTAGTFVLISGRLGDILGHKRMFVFGYGWFGVWSAFAGFAAYPGRLIWFDFCRAMQGIGPAIIMTNGLALFGRTYPPGTLY